MSIAFAPTPQAGSEALGDAVIYYAIPWWVKAIQFVVQIPVIGTLGVLGIIGYLVYSKYFS